ncbi:MAG: hypothetical protein M1546_16720 [Chloroflexi bacterium]|nr:hypothetical protein [Chloroflexota bacterium]
MAGSRAALRVGLIGGMVLGLAVVAQLTTDSPELQSLGFILVSGGFGITGYFAAREAGDFSRWPAVRAGAVGGLIAGLIASLAATALLLFWSISGEGILRVELALQQSLSAESIQQFADNGFSMDSLAQLVIAIQLLCCNATLPLAGLLLGGLGGALIPSFYQGRASGQSDDQ